MNTAEHKAIADNVAEKGRAFLEAVSAAEEPLRYALGGILNTMRMRLNEFIPEVERFQPITRQVPRDRRLDELAELLTKVAREHSPLRVSYEDLATLLANASEAPSACIFREVGPLRGHLASFGPELRNRLDPMGIKFATPLPTDRGERVVILVDVGAWEAAPHAKLYDHFSREGSVGCYLCGERLDDHDIDVVARKPDPRKSHTIRNLHSICAPTFVELAGMLAQYEDFVAAERADAEAGRSGAVPKLALIPPPERTAELDVPLREDVAGSSEGNLADRHSAGNIVDLPDDDEPPMSRTPPDLSQARELDEPPKKGGRRRGK